MKSITIKTTKEHVTDPSNGNSIEFSMSTFNLIKTAVNNTPPGGFEVTDMMNRLKLDRVIQDYEKQKEKEKRVKLKQEELATNESDEVEVGPETTEKDEDDEEIKLTAIDLEGKMKLEDAMFEKLGEYARMTKWSFKSQTILDFIELFTATPTTKK